MIGSTVKNGRLNAEYPHVGICHRYGVDRSVAPEPRPEKTEGVKMQTKTIFIEVHGGVVTVTKCPKGCRVRITDYDADNAEGYTRWVVDPTLAETKK